MPRKYEDIHFDRSGYAPKKAQKLCRPCREFLARYSCNAYRGECDCPKCQGICKCPDSLPN